MRISILCSDPSHPVMPWLQSLISKNADEHVFEIAQQTSSLSGGDLLFLISCTDIVKADVRKNYLKTLVIHSSDLPEGRGWSPQVWQILEGKNCVTVSLIEASDRVDCGDVWRKKTISFEGHELYDEIYHKLFSVWMELIEEAIDNWFSVIPIRQCGKPTYYRKRTPEDSRINPKLSLESQFDLLRVCDPVRYPAFFELRGKKYLIIIRKIDCSDANT